MLVKDEFFEKTKSFGSGRGGHKVEYIVLFCTRTTGLRRTIELCIDQNEKRSYHFIIGRNGNVVQLVRTTNTSWHSGESRIEKLNNKSISIALVGAGNLYTKKQYKSLIGIVLLINKVFFIKQENILGYEEVGIGPGIVSPGPNFDWEYFSGSIYGFDNVNLFNKKKETVPVMRTFLDKNIYGPGI